MAVSTDEVGAQAVSAQRRRWRFPWLQAIAALVIVAGACVYLYPQTAAWFAQRVQARVIAQNLVVEDPNAPQRAHELARAHAYNEALASGAFLGANANVPTSSAAVPTEDDYEDILNTATSGIMARLRYERAGIDLPVYHGTSDATLLAGVGHLEGTSLPVGGEGTRAVLTGHRGLATATMFTNLDKAKVGDTFTVEVQGEVLTYRVIETQVIAPEDTEELRAVPGKDLITLVTCTPLGINTHRILVTGERITPTPIADVAAANQPSHLPGFPWWAVILGVVLASAAVYVWWSGYPARPRKRARTTEAAAPPV